MSTSLPMITAPFESLPRRIFLDSCTVQTLRDYGGYIYEGEAIPDSDRIQSVTDGIANIEALRDVFLVNERAPFEWIVSREAYRRRRTRTIPGTSNGSTISPITLRSAWR